MKSCSQITTGSPTVLFRPDIGTTEVSCFSEWALWGPAEPDGLESVKPSFNATEKQLALEDISCDLTHLQHQHLSHLSQSVEKSELFQDPERYGRS